MLQALKCLDAKLTGPLQLLVGGGAAMLMLYDFPFSTLDIDAVIYNSTLKEADILPFLHDVARELSLPKDWLNSYFGVFLYSLPKDYGQRLVKVYYGKYLKAVGLGKEDLLILKCMAGRAKDRSHAASLLKQGADVDFVECHLHHLVARGIPKAEAAVDFFDDLLNDLGKQ